MPDYDTAAPWCQVCMCGTCCRVSSMPSYPTVIRGRACCTVKYHGGSDIVQPLWTKISNRTSCFLPRSRSPTVRSELVLLRHLDQHYCNRVYWHKKLTGQGSESHWRKTASSFRREATRPMPSAAHFYNPPTLALPSSGRTTSRSSWGSRSVASFSPDGSWSQILGSV